MKRLWSFESKIVNRKLLMVLIRLSIVFGRGLNYRMVSIDFRMNDEGVSVYIDDTLKSSHSYVRYNMHTIRCKMDDTQKF